MQNSHTEISSDCIQTVMDGLRKNNMDVQYVPHKEEAAAVVASLLKEGDTIAVGGSVTLEETVPTCFSALLMRLQRTGRSTRLTD